MLPFATPLALYSILLNVLITCHTLFRRGLLSFLTTFLLGAAFLKFLRLLAGVAILDKFDQMMPVDEHLERNTHTKTNKSIPRILPLMEPFSSN